MFITTVDQDPLEYQAILRRRRIEEERKKRIFNPRQRCIGIDVELLNQQVDERKQSANELKQIEDSYAQNLKANDRLLEIVHQQRIELGQQLDKQCAEFNFGQKPEARREFDLNNPKRLWAEKPGRVSDDDPRCGPSSIQKFDGEDLKRQERIREQQMQMKVWTALAKQEALKRREEQLSDKELEAEWWRKVDEQALRLKEEEERRRRERVCEMQGHNKQKADEIRAQEPDKSPHLTSLLVPALADLSIDRPHIWKFYSDEQRSQILKEEQESKKDLEERRRYEKERNRIWFEHQKLLADTAEKMEQQRLEYEKEKLRAAAHINQWKAKDDKAREYFLNRVLYTNPPTDAYFSQFNTTSR